VLAKPEWQLELLAMVKLVKLSLEVHLARSHADTCCVEAVADKLISYLSNKNEYHREMNRLID